MSRQQPIRILLVDDQVLFVESLKDVLEMRTRDLKVVGTVHDGLQAIRAVDELNPDVVLMDVRMANMDGIASTKIIRTKHPEVRIVILTTFNDDEYVHEALQCGAVGYLLKTARPAELIASIRAIQEGVVQMSPPVVARLTHSERSFPDVSHEDEAADQWTKYLSHREKEILKCLLAGLSNKQIAEKLFVVEQTIKNHLNVIYSKMDAHSRAQAIKKCAEAGIDLSSY